MHYSIYQVFIMRDKRFWNLVVKMTTHGLSCRSGILALLVLKEPTALTRSVLEMKLNPSHWNKVKNCCQWSVDFQSNNWLPQNALTWLGWTAVDSCVQAFCARLCSVYLPVFVFVLIFICLLHRLVNENEVKQWRDQAEKFRKGKTCLTHCTLQVEKETTQLNASCIFTSINLLLYFLTNNICFLVCTSCLNCII